MSMTPEQCRLEIIADTQRLMSIGLLWNRMSASQQAMTRAGLALAQENGPAAQAYFAALAAKVDALMHAMRANPAGQSWWWELWGADPRLGDGEVCLLAAFPEEVCTQEQAEEAKKVFAQCGCVKLELRHVLR